MPSSAMNLVRTATSLLFAASCVQCLPSSASLHANCKDYTIPVTITAEKAEWIGPKWSDNAGLTDFITNVSSRNPNVPSPFGIPKSQTLNYDIVIVATHGNGFERSYWDIGYKPSQYSFVEHATSQGYSVFLYDRVGVGKSSRISGYDNQYSIQVPVLNRLIEDVKCGKYTGGKPSKIAIIGHSFGSAVTHGVIAYHADTVDACVLTGYNVDFEDVDFRLANEANNPRIDEAGGHDTGYMTWVDLYAGINGFFKAPAYDIEAARYAEAHKQPFAVGEQVTLVPSVKSLPKSPFKGPVMIISGEFDYPACNGYCPDILEPAGAKAFPVAKPFEAYVQPAAGHGLNYHRNATATYNVILDFLSKNGV